MAVEKDWNSPSYSLKENVHHDFSKIHFITFLLTESEAGYLLCGRFYGEANLQRTAFHIAIIPRDLTKEQPQQ